MVFTVGYGNLKKFQDYIQKLYKLIIWFKFIGYLYTIWRVEDDG